MQLDSGEILPPQIEDPFLLQAVPARQPAYKVEDIPDFPVGTFVVSIQRRSKFRRLHVVGSCAYRAGVGFALFEAFGKVMPPLASFTAQCEHCFKAADGSGGKDATSNDSPISSESSSDSS